MSSKEQIICCICKKPIPVKGTWAAGNNAEPVANGRCCDYCDDSVVIPARIKAMYMRRELAEEEAEKIAKKVKKILYRLP